tara:strand:- start:213 stop:683 length:471 start_codon:yes stop_codon:yes gene_type:complete
MENLKREIGLGGSTIVGHLKKTTTVTGAGGSTTLTAADSGGVFFVSLASGSHTMTLPALTAGFNIEVIVTVVAGSAARDLIITAPGDNMIVSARDFTASGAAQRHTTNTFTTLTFDSSAGAVAPVGSRVRIFCDGTNYVCIADSDHQDGSTIMVGS